MLIDKQQFFLDKIVERMSKISYEDMLRASKNFPEEVKSYVRQKITLKKISDPPEGDFK